MGQQGKRAGLRHSSQEERALGLQEGLLYPHKALAVVVTVEALEPSPHMLQKTLERIYSLLTMITDGRWDDETISTWTLVRHYE